MTFIISLFLIVLLTPPLLAQGSKLRVIADRAYIHVDPDINSPVIEVVEKGDVLTLLSKRKIKDIWHYVSFFSGRRAVIVSGFVFSSAVEAIEVVPEAAEAEKAKPEARREVEFEISREIEVILEQANVRAEPDVAGEILQQVQLGTVLLSTAKAGEWYKVKLPPDEQGNILTGYIHRSFVKALGEEIEEIKEAEEPLMAPQPEKKGFKFKMDYIKLGINYFQFSEKSRRDIYNEGIDYELEVVATFWKGFQGWFGSNYYYKSEGDNRIKVFPIGIGVKYNLAKGIFNFYAGLGVSYYIYDEYSPPLNESKGAVGYVGKLGSFVRIKGKFIADFHLNYSYCYLKLTSENVNIGGAEVGFALGYVF